LHAVAAFDVYIVSVRHKLISIVVKWVLKLHGDAPACGYISDVDDALLWH